MDNKTEFITFMNAVLSVEESGKRIEIMKDTISKILDAATNENEEFFVETVRVAYEDENEYLYNKYFNTIDKLCMKYSIKKNIGYLIYLYYQQNINHWDDPK